MATDRRGQHEQWLLGLTQVPTAAGREGRVIEWIRRWVAERSELKVTEDKAGNLVVSPRRRWGAGKAAAPLYITAHLDHPGFVVERIVGPGTVEGSFRGGVMDVFFEDGARVVLHPASGGGDVGTTIGATLSGRGSGDGPAGKTYLAELDDGADSDAVSVGDVATWALPPGETKDGHLHTWACDDLAAAAAALAAMDVLLEKARGGERPGQDVRLLFTRAEEIGFIGAIAACKARTIPKQARIIALENSRSFADSPIGGGPIVRVGDRVSVFTPWLTAACAKRAEEVFGRPAVPRASRAVAAVGEEGRPWQRKLMSGGACEATVFCAYGYQATCLCLPLGNYHNMPHLAELQSGTYDRERWGPPRAAREFISVEDFHGLVDLLVGIAGGLPPADSALGMAERLWGERAFVLGREVGAARKRKPRRAARSGGRGRRRAARGRGSATPRKKRGRK